MFNITMKQLDAYLASQCISLDTVKPIRKAIKGYIADKDSVSEAIEKAIEDYEEKHGKRLSD